MSTRIKYLIEKLQSESLKDDQRDQLQINLKGDKNVSKNQIPCRKTSIRVIER